MPGSRWELWISHHELAHSLSLASKHVAKPHWRDQWSLKRSMSSPFVPCCSRPCLALISCNSILDLLERFWPRVTAVLFTSDVLAEQGFQLCFGQILQLIFWGVGCDHTATTFPVALSWFLVCWVRWLDAIHKVEHWRPNRPSISQVPWLLQTTVTDPELNTNSIK